MSYIKLQGRGLLFDNYCWHEYVKRVDWENLSGSSNQAAIYAGLASNAYTEGEEKPSWKEVGEFVRSLSLEDIEKVKVEFEAMNEYKKFIEKLAESATDSVKVDTKKKHSKALKKT
jgi:hypothetical protein